MLEQSFGLTFFLKSSSKESKERTIYLRVTVDGVPKETSTKRKRDAARWNQKLERATGIKEDAKAVNLFLDTLAAKVNQYRTNLMLGNETITGQKLIDFILGKNVSKAKVIEEFALHNSEVLALVPKEYSKVTYIRYETAKAHVHQFLKYRYEIEDYQNRNCNEEPENSLMYVIIILVFLLIPAYLFYSATKTFEDKKTSLEKKENEEINNMK